MCMATRVHTVAAKSGGKKSGFERVSDFSMNAGSPIGLSLAAMPITSLNMLS